MERLHYGAAVFDLDGTLLDSLLDLYLSTNHALSLMGFPQRTREEVRRFVGNGVERLMRRAVPEGTAEEAFQQCFRLFRQHYVDHCRDHTAPYPGIIALLQALRRQGVPAAIVSNKLQEGVDELQAQHFSGLVSVAIGEHPGARRKPAPDMVVQAVRQLQTEPSRCLYIGDSEVDVQTARNAGLDCVAVLWGFRSRRELEQAGATRFVGSPAELLPYFG